MPNILIRDLPDTDADTIRAAAETRGLSMQKLITELLQKYAAAERNRRSISEHGARLRARHAAGMPPVDTDALLAEVDRETDERTARLVRLANGGEL